MNVELDIRVEPWALRKTFRTTVREVIAVDLLCVTLRHEGHVGRGEAAGVHYKGETARAMKSDIEQLFDRMGGELDRDELQSLLPPGGARNALDCALWDLEAKISGVPVWQRLGAEPPVGVRSVFTCSADNPKRMAEDADQQRWTEALKIKLTGSPEDEDRVRAVRGVRPDAWLSVDANQGYSLDGLRGILPVLIEADVALIEQPLPVGQEALLDQLVSPIPIVGDESIDDVRDVERAAGRFGWINIKLDKCGGLTEALQMREAARSLGIQVTVGNMIGTSLAMAPAFLLAQDCAFADLDGPLFLKGDRAIRAQYRDSRIFCPEAIWGAAALRESTTR